jgi:putative nucleotidyltransferase with HDIG domain
MSDPHYLSVDALRVGLYVHIDMKWFEHPFAFSHFKIKSDEQIKIIRSLGLKNIRIDPPLSDEDAISALNSVAAAVPVVSLPEEAAEPSPIMLAKRAMMECMRERRDNAERIERAFIDTAQTIRDIEKNLYSRPVETVKNAETLVTNIVNSILTAPELAIQVMGDKMGGEELYFHSLNVTMLSLMLARAMQLPVQAVQTLGIGALMHDIGHKEVSDKILRKTGPLTQAERNFFELHCQYGLEIGKRLKLAAPALAIIGEHHELFDGSGYPAKLKAESIGLLSRIVVIANYYDELCNPNAIAEALTPHEALSLMFSRLRQKFDPKLLQLFIRCLGVYPPGTIVQLSNGFIGMVTTVNTARPTKPVLIVYDAEVPKEEAMLLDMDRETEVNIAKAIRPVQVPAEVYNYLSPRKRVSYYFDASSARAKTGKL